MRTSSIVQFTVMIALSFVCGVICFQLFDLQQATALINLMDARILQQDAPSIWQTILPLAISIVIVVLFATHPYCAFIAKWLIALRATFLGFSSVYLLAQQKSLLAYGIWWFPFQFIYCILLLAICLIVSTKTRKMPKRGILAPRRLIVMIIVFIVVACFELVAISYVFK
ncbi:hypothetical protein [Solibacillus sp. CAU 1738]|uniref:hypothetical protein n=1 Tax=Solibacillus sp. CAU 1738 TaxID=3140363 RepID=UPI0032617DFC